MTRSMGIVLLLVTLVIGAVLFALQSRNQGPTAQSVTAAETLATQVSAASNFQPADQLLQVALGTNGTYVGAELPPGSGVVLVSATQTSYCLQTGVGTAVEHELGPGGAAQPGPCP
jgi:hypothetical protein